jgi:type I restriction enzyme, S subunit
MKSSEGIYKYLKFSSFIETSFWDYYTLSHKSIINSNFPVINLGEVLHLRKDFIQIDNDITYKRCRVQIQGKGVVLRDHIVGNEIKTKKQQICKTDDFLVAEIDAKVGGYGIVPPELDGAIVSGHYFLFDIDKSKLLPAFLRILVKSEKFSKQVKSTGSTNYAAIRPYHVLGYKIPLPALQEQEIFINHYEALQNLANTFEEKSQTLFNNIEEYLFNELAIKRVIKEIKTSKLNVVEFINLERWGVDFNQSVSKKGVLYSNKFKNEKLKNILFINPLTKLPNENMIISFIPMECVSDEYGEVIEFREIEVNESKGYTKFQDGDLIWARITPCMENGKSAIATGLKNGYGCGSTEFHVLRNTSDEIDLRYIHLLLRTTVVLENAVKYFTGSAGQQRVPKFYLENLEIPIPPLSKQRELVDYISSIKEQIKDYKVKSLALDAQAKEEFENVIYS